jgi:simple sugar transport system ATP-binding protein
MSQEPILQVEGVHKRFGGNHAVRGVGFDLFPGEVLALAGDNGAGKSTVIKMISGVYSSDAGTVRFQGRPITDLTPQQVRDMAIETIYQDLALAENLDVGINLFLGRERMKRAFGFLPVIDRRWMNAEAKKALKDLGISIPDPDQPVRNLSGGQRQAIAISRAVYWNAKVLIMDEPTAALGVPEQREVMDLIRRLQEREVAIILISHNLHDIFQISDRIVVLERGRKAGERLTKHTDEDEIVRLMMGGGRADDGDVS